MSDEKLRIAKDELFAPAVDQALARERAGRERIVAAPPPVSPVRRLLLNSLFHMPLAAVLATLLVYALFEPKFTDTPIVGGEVILVNNDPFDAPGGVVALTVGESTVYLDPDHVILARGAAGEPAFADARNIQVGDRVEIAAMRGGDRLVAVVIRPAPRAHAHALKDTPLWVQLLMFPAVAALIAAALLSVEGVISRNWLRMIERTLIGAAIAAAFALVSVFVVGRLFMVINQHVLSSEVRDHPEKIFVTARNVSGWGMFLLVVGRSAAWAGVGAATGVGMNLVRATKAQLRNSVVGGAIGGALGGLFFDPIIRWSSATVFDGGSTSRLVGLLAVGLSIGLFVALVERMGRDAWLRVRTGPLAGKSFILYKTPTIIGNAPASDVYLYKDAEIDPSHAQIHRVGTTYEIEDMGSRMGTDVGGSKVRRKRLVSGDQITIGATILDFEERQKRAPQA